MVEINVDGASETTEQRQSFPAKKLKGSVEKTSRGDDRLVWHVQKEDGHIMKMGWGLKSRGNIVHLTEGLDVCGALKLLGRRKFTETDFDGWIFEWLYEEKSFEKEGRTIRNWWYKPISIVDAPDVPESSTPQPTPAQPEASTSTPIPPPSPMETFDEQLRAGLTQPEIFKLAAELGISKVDIQSHVIKYDANGKLTLDSMNGKYKLTE